MLVLVYRKCSTCLKALKWLEENINNNKIVAIGEIGLDYHYDTNKEWQKEVFIKLILKFENIYQSPINCILKFAIYVCFSSIHLKKSVILNILFSITDFS